MNQHLKIEKQKNGLLELMRFLCAASVILFHINKDVWKKKLILLDMGWMGKLTPAKNGNICVEFFFLLSGLFMVPMFLLQDLFRQIVSHMIHEEKIDWEP